MAGDGCADSFRLNSDGGQVKKALLSVVVGYATICVTIVKWLFLLAIRLTDGF